MLELFSLLLLKKTSMSRLLVESAVQQKKHFSHRCEQCYNYEQAWHEYGLETGDQSLFISGPLISIFRGTCMPVYMILIEDGNRMGNFHYSCNSSLTI